MNKKILKAGPSPRATAFDWPAALVVVLVGAVASGLIVAQFRDEQLYFRNPNQNYQYSELSLALLDDRVAALENAPNAIERDKLCVPLSAFCRSLAVALPPDARIFLTGMLGPTNAPKTGYYFFLKNYLFPRTVDISLDGHATDGVDGFSGVPCDSPEVLKTNGYDLMINGQLQLIPLTLKGVPRAE